MKLENFLHLIIFTFYLIYLKLCTY